MTFEAFVDAVDERVRSRAQAAYGVYRGPAVAFWHRDDISLRLRAGVDDDVELEITGPRAGEIVAVSTTLDPTSPVLAPGRCAQTLFGGVKVVLYAYGDGFRLHAERQFSAFLLEWLRQAASALA